MTPVVLLAVALAATAQPVSAGVAELMRELRDGNPRARTEAAYGLAALGPAARDAAGELAHALADDNTAVSTAAAYALSRVGRDAVPALAQALRHRDPDVRATAALMLGKLGGDAAGAVSALLEAAHDAEPAVSEGAVVALGRVVDAAPTLGEQHGAEISAVLATIVGRRGAQPWLPFLRSEAARAAGKLGPAGQPAVPALLAGLKDADARVRSACAWALGGGYLAPTSARWILPRATRGGIGPTATGAVPALEIALGDADPFVRWAAAQALPGFGAAARGSIPDLKRLLGEQLTAPVAAADDEDVLIVPVGAPSPQASPPPGEREMHADVLRLQAAGALWELGETSAADTLTRLLREDASPTLRELAARLLGLLRVGVAENALVSALEDPDAQVRDAASAALELIRGE